MAEALRQRVGHDLRAFVALATMWVRVSWSYRTSFLVMTTASFVITGVDFVAILVMFANVDRLGGFGLGPIAFLYGATSLALGVSDLVVGNVERIGRLVRLGSFDAMMVRPVGVLAQVAANEFALRRLGRIVQGALVFAVSVAVVDVDWDVARVAMSVSMVLFGTMIFLAFFVLGAAFQFVSTDASEVANAFTYGGAMLNQYPLSVYDARIVRGLTFVLPLAFVNWQPGLYVLGRPDPLGLPSWTGLLSPAAALALAAVAALAWRAGIRRYRSTGS